MSASVLKRSIRPRRRSLTRGWDTRSTFAASRCLRRRVAMSFWTWIIRSARTRRCSASSRRKPRSRNTLPVEGVTLSFVVILSSRQLAGASLDKQSSEPLAGEFHLGSGRCSRALLERMENIDSLCELSDIQNSMFERCVDPNLPHSRPDSCHVLPIQRRQASLDSPKLEPCQPPDDSGKTSNVLARAAKPLKLLVEHDSIYKFSYVWSSTEQRCSAGATGLAR